MTVAHKGLSDYTQEEVERFRARGIDGAMDILLGMPGRPAYVGKTSDSREVAIEMMVSYLKRLRMDISGLSIIHVAGTKGKGSTCAFTESILRAHGAKTGMFTSPHLIHPNERFRINGKPISDEIFLTNFWAVWDGLSATMNEAQGFPPIANFFRFFTLMALRMFQEERVDVVILEVGLGGRLDATNVVEKPVVCGITTLDLDHTRVLGDTLDKIAREKAGIMKSNVPVFTIAQPEIAANMLAKCSIEHNAPLVVVPPLSDFNISAHDLKHSLGMHGEYQRVNAALAIVLASTWLGAKHGTPLPPFNAIITPTILEGLKLAFWPGRSQTVVDPLSSTIFHVDGAHTPLSIECCAQCIVKIPSVEEALLKANLDIAGLPSDVFNTDAFPPQDDRMYWQFVCEKTWTILNQLHGFPTATSIFPSVEKTLEWIRETAPQDTKVLVTGSLYNVGDTLSALEWKE
ncbi:unnamed protein product [Aphanomyces euteiches]